MVFRRFWTNWLQTYVTECHEFASACAGVKMLEIRERIISRIIALLSPSSPPRTSPSSSLGHSWPGQEWMVGPYYNLGGYDGYIWGFSQRLALCLQRSSCMVKRNKQTDRHFCQKFDWTSENMISWIITPLNTLTSVWFFYIGGKWGSDYSADSSHQVNKCSHHIIIEYHQRVETFLSSRIFSRSNFIQFVSLSKEQPFSKLNWSWNISFWTG